MIRFRTSSWWAYAAAAVVVTAAYCVCVGPAFFGHGRWTVGGAIGALVGALAGSRYRDSAYWRLAATDRRRVVEARWSGAPTWDPGLDVIVLDQLERAARQARGRRVTAVVVALAAIALPVAASLRTGTAWYLLCLLPLAIPAADVAREAFGEDPRVRLARFDAAVDGPPTP